MAIPALTPLSTPPGRSQDDFDDAMATTLAEIDTMVDQLNLALAAINAVLPNLELVPAAAAAAATATEARDVVLAARDAVLNALDATLAARDAAVAAAASLALPDITATDAGKSLMVDANGALVLAFAALVMTGATATDAGVGGLVPPPAAGSQDKVLFGNGLWGDLPAVPSGASKWTALAAGTDYTATPASTSTLTMITDQTATLKQGMALRYTIGGTAYYGVVTAITANLLTVAGAPLSGDVTALSYSIFPGMVEVVQIFVPGYWADSADSSLIVNDLVSPLLWGGPPAVLVRIQAMTRTTDTGATFPRANARTGSSTTDRICTSLSGAGLAMAASATWYSTVVDIDPTKYSVNLGDAVELTTDANGGNDNAADLSVILTFVYA